MRFVCVSDLELALFISTCVYSYKSLIFRQMFSTLSKKAQIMKLTCCIRATDAQNSKDPEIPQSRVNHNIHSCFTLYYLADNKSSFRIEQ